MCQIDSGLTAEGGNDAKGLFQLDDIHDILYAERLEIQLIRAGVIGGNRLGVVVDDDGFIARLFDGLYGMNGGIVKLYALTDTNGPRAKHNDLFLIRDHRLIFFLVGGIEVRNVAVKLGCAGVDHLVNGDNACRAAEVIDLNFTHAPKLCDLLIGEAHLLCRTQNLGIAGIFGELSLLVHDVFQLTDEEHVNGGGIGNSAPVTSTAQQLGNGIDTVVGTDFDIVEQFRLAHTVKLTVMQMMQSDLKGTDRLEKAFLNGSADAHNLARRLHLRGERIVGVREFIKREARHLGDHIVQRRFKGRRSVGNLNLIQRHAHADLCRNTGNGITARLGRQRRRTGNTGVDLNQVILEGMGVKSKLNIASALDLQRANDLQRTVAEHMIFLIGERLRGTNDNGVACVDSHGVDVLHVTDGDGSVVFVAHHLVFDLLEALDALLDQNLMNRRERQGVFHHWQKFFLVIRKSAARAAQRKGGTKHHGITDLLGNLQAFLKGIGNIRRKHRLAKALTKLLEQLSVLRPLDRLTARSEKLNAALLKNSFLFKLHGKVKTRLTADSRKNGVGTLKSYDLCDIFQRQRLHIDLIGNAGIGHNGRGVGIAKNDLIAFLLECKAGLRSGIVEFRRLSDDDGAGTDDQNLFDIRSLRHCSFPPP